MRSFETRGDDTLLVTFDDEKISLDEILDALEKAQISVQGKPEFLN